MLSRLRTNWSEFTPVDKAVVVVLSPFALAIGFAVGLIGAIYLLTSPLFGA